MFNISNNQANSDDVIYKDFRDGMKNQAREQVRLAGEVVRSVVKRSTITQTINSFCQLEQHFENIENNLNKVRVLTKPTTK